MAPEVINAQQHGFSVDYFALGVIIHELMLGKRPFPGIVRKEYKESIMHMNPCVKSKNLPQGWSNEVCDIINSLINGKEDQRLGKNGAKSVKCHPWFADINWDDVSNRTMRSPFVPQNVRFLLILP